MFWSLFKVLHNKTLKIIWKWKNFLFFEIMLKIGYSGRINGCLTYVTKYIYSNAL